jgi:uncharacterized membrane protein YcjF (UPF0283 family)
MNRTLAVAAVLFVIAMLIGIVQLWFSPWSADTFVKIEMTLGALLGIAVVAWFVVREYREDKANRSGSRLDP